jgi:asparagine synthase (glutamine-hydrolysing)
MSGICAVWRKAETDKTSHSLAAVCTGLALAPSERGRTATEGNAGVGVSARFPTQQVFQNADLLIACDAELFNDAELRKLTGDVAGASPESSIAARMAALYERFGTGFLEKLRGDFSVVLFDRRKQELLAATDGFGVHPLVYYDDGKVLLVASRIDALLASGEVSRDINPNAIANYLNYTVNLAPGTIFAKVTRLLPGTFLLASEGQSATHRYWDMKYVANGPADEAELSRKLEAVVEAAVAAQCQDDPFSGIGAFLSGGTDSSTVVGMMSRTGRGPVKTFSIGFDEERFNELEYARITARKFQADHHELFVNANDCFEALPEMIRYFDEPFGNSSAIPTYFCAKLAAQNGVHVLLAGDGGDELFAGNERYLTDKIFDSYHKIPWLLRKGCVEPMLAFLPFQNGIVGRARNYVRRSNQPHPERFFSFNLLSDNPAGQIFEDDFLRSLSSYSVLEIPSQYYWKGPGLDPLDRMLYLDVKITLGDNDLLKVTRMSELAGVRPRFPFLDRSVAEFSGTIPAGLKVKGIEKRYLFKRAFRELLPIEVLQKKKHGFGIPVASWMKSDKRMRELTREVLLSPRTYQRGYIRRSFVEDLFVQHEADTTPFYGDTLWTFLTLELWFRQFVDEPRYAAV